ncbi:MAG: putative conserved domain protein [uncultured Nocardioides sp.]|uniref:Putative conserved domain protein n=1 Tax=uncultured Nocardioides sp. TaxID=198441 RepID=A0A6J4NBK7_9ACTN|nr:MAG: putative conserved domain protein [uncultured Nocardioides sp.]
MINENELRNVIGRNAYDSNGDKIGKVGHVFLDDETGQPEFATVNTGLFGTSETFVPIANASISGDQLNVPFTKDQIKDAPNVDADGGHLDQSEEARLYQHYGMSYSERSSDTGLPSGYDDDSNRDSTRNVHGTEGHDTSGPTTDDAMTRSEERLQVGTTSQEAGRARLRKYVTSETETATVPVTKERAVIETEAITDGNVGDALDGPAISEEEHEVVLREEQAVAEKVAEPVERVRLGKETVTENETVTEEVRKEHIEAEGDVTDRRGNL